MSIGNKLTSLYPVNKACLERTKTIHLARLFFSGVFLHGAPSSLWTVSPPPSTPSPATPSLSGRAGLQKLSGTLAVPQSAVGEPLRRSLLAQLSGVSGSGSSISLPTRAVSALDKAGSIATRLNYPLPNPPGRLLLRVRGLQAVLARTSAGGEPVSARCGDPWH